ncbi:biopolymer transporter ExbD [Pelagibius sp. Alg239-R121]|uniref:ExbD/TolR family protein n=1 Tax=Pelagibius sp. Alg239-R121 TaxID=2993448 RepID=UPI0024A75998|nr:biopolymer transporter ExbD [Pelagibius sp. Alg239-R121]
MRFLRANNRLNNHDAGILPLINVVFLLLIFFMLAGHLAASDPFAITPPKSQSEGRNSPQDLVILVSADGRFALDGVEMSEEGVIKAASERLRKSPAGETPGLRLKTDGNAPAARIVRLMQRLRQAGIQKLKLLTIPAN